MSVSVANRAECAVIQVCRSGEADFALGIVETDPQKSCAIIELGAQQTTEHSIPTASPELRFVFVVISDASYSSVLWIATAIRTNGRRNA